MLGRAIKAFGEGSKAKVPLRDSKLTRLLQESLGGSSKTWMIATCSGSPAHQGETLSTLEYAANAMKIVNNVTQNRLARALELNEQKELNKRLEAEIDRLKDDLLQRRTRSRRGPRRWWSRGWVPVQCRSSATCARSCSGCRRRRRRPVRWRRSCG
eukprot:Sspe_Gene.2057::Locus_680_Transcript_1_1_Confidence_1.000_Length_2886::g.2057::m.2057